MPMGVYDAYVFDIQGTLFDFFGPVADALSEWVDDEVVGDAVRAWRQDYFERTSTLTQSAEHWQPVQNVYRDGLDSVAKKLGLQIPSPARTALADTWKNLRPWPDSVDGLRDLRQISVVASLSNTDMATMVHLFKRAGMDWDAVLTAEVFGAFKPASFLYERTCRYLGVEPDRAAMVASHPYDLRAARAVGMKTVFVHRPLEFGRIDHSVDDARGEFDHRIDSIADMP